MHKCVDIRGGLNTFTLSGVTTDHEKISTYEGGPSSLITSKCIVWTADVYPDVDKELGKDQL